tara:strand:+ start:9955 stop:10158 length:204 start_codon:yes stop_codon:yes gene_type:complete
MELRLDRNWFKVGDLLTTPEGHTVYILGCKGGNNKWLWWQKILWFLTFGFYFKKKEPTSWTYKIELR